MDTTNAMGSVAFWSFSPAIDFLEGASNIDPLEFWTGPGRDSVNILLVGTPDLCHLIQNLPESLRRTERCTNFYLLENNIEVYARQLLLLWLLAEPQENVGLQEKVWMWMEIVGNTLLRPSTAQYVEKAAAQLADLVTSGEDGGGLLPLVCLSELRHRERDQLAAVFRFWRAPGAAPDLTHLWDLRLRQGLAQRYDARAGVFDWDYFMRLRDRLEAEFVQPEEYKRWRETGVAFRRPGTEPSCSNRTLVTARALGRPGERQLRLGYWGDVVSGPFAPFGIRSRDPRLLRKQNGRLTASAAEVYAANLEALVRELGGSLAGAAHVKVVLLPADGGVRLGRRAAHRAFFDAALFSSGMSHLLTPALAGCLRPGAAVLLETARYIVPVSAEQQAALLRKYGEIAGTAHCEPLVQRARSAPEKAANGGSEASKEGEGDQKASVGDRDVEESKASSVSQSQVQIPSRGDVEEAVRSADHSAGDMKDEQEKESGRGGAEIGHQVHSKEGNKVDLDEVGDTTAIEQVSFESNLSKLDSEGDVLSVCLTEGMSENDKQIAAGDKEVKQIAKAKASEAILNLGARPKERSNPLNVARNENYEPTTLPTENEKGFADETRCPDGENPFVNDSSLGRQWVADKLTSIPEWVGFTKMQVS